MCAVTSRSTWKSLTKVVPFRLIPINLLIRSLEVFSAEMIPAPSFVECTPSRVGPSLSSSERELSSNARRRKLGLYFFPFCGHQSGAWLPHVNLLLCGVTNLSMMIASAHLGTPLNISAFLRILHDLIHKLQRERERERGLRGRARV